MTDYIKREDAIKELLGCVPTDAHEIKDLDVIRVMLALPAADVAPVVLCKDCRYWDEHSQYGYDDENGTYGNYCMIWTPDDDFYAVETPADGFCYNGERKDNG